MTATATRSLATALPGRYLSLATRRADGTEVATPMWFAVDGDRLVLRTPASSPKARRLRTTGVATIRAADWQGRASGPTLAVTAIELLGDAAQRADRVLHDRYGWQWNVVPVIPLPGVRSAHRGLSLRDRWRLATATDLWPESTIFRLEAVGGPTSDG